MAKRWWWVGVVMFASGLSFASTSVLEELKMDKRFGIGISAGGPYSLMGIEADVNITEVFSIAAGLGTGIDYSTFSVKAKYYLLGKEVSPYLGLGFGRWWSDGTKDRNLGPAVLRNRFLRPDEDPMNGFSCYLMYPAVGVQYLHPSGFAVSAEVQYLFRLFSFANGTYAGLGAHWFF